MNQNTSEKPRKCRSLTAFVLVLVIAHFLFALAVPVAFIYELKPLLSEGAFNIWLCQPVFIAIFLMVAKNESQMCRTLVYIDIGVSVLQKTSIFFLYAIVDKIG